MGCGSWGHRESDRTEPRAHTHSDNSEASHSNTVFFNKISNDVSIIITQCHSGGFDHFVVHGYNPENADTE